MLCRAAAAAAAAASARPAYQRTRRCVRSSSGSARVRAVVLQADIVDVSLASSDGQSSGAEGCTPTGRTGLPTGAVTVVAMRAQARYCPWACIVSTRCMADHAPCLCSQAGASGFDATVPQHNPFSRQSNGGTFWDFAAGGAAHAAPSPGSLCGKRGNDGAGLRAQPAFEQHGLDRQASGSKTPRASDSDQTAPAIARTGSGLSRWTSEFCCLYTLSWLCWRRGLLAVCHGLSCRRACHASLDAIAR